MTRKTHYRLALLISILLLSSLACGVCGLEAFLPKANTGGTVEVPAEQPAASLPTTTPIPQKTPRTVTLRPDGSGDYPTIESAVADLVAGSTIILEAGEFLTSAPLEINYSLTIQGKGIENSFVVGSVGRTVLNFTGPGDLTLNSVAFQYTGIDWARVVEVTDATIMIRDCSFTGGVRDEVEEKGGTGLYLRGNTSGSVFSSVFKLNDHDGMDIIDTGNVFLESNLFINNSQAGLIFWDDAIGEVRNNIAQDNGKHGFSLQDQANVLFENNTATGSGQSGFGIFDNSILTARQNDSSNNGNHGFYIGEESNATLEGNFMRNNSDGGVSVTGNAFLDASSNDINGNSLSGLFAKENSQATLYDNFIHENGEAGIRVSDNAVVEATNNEVSGNGLSGFIVRDNAMVTFGNNVSRNNKEAGFAFFGNSSGTLTGNTCSGNGMKGILIYDNANPTIGVNTCP